VLRVHFWGTRGSLPVALTAPAVRAKVIAALTRAAGRNLSTPEQIATFVDRDLDFATAGTFGGHSACVQIDTGGDEFLLCDMGSGLRAFSQKTLKQRAGKPAMYHLLVSHMHWDHIMGFPFFTPAYIPGNRIRIYGCHEGLEAAIRRQQDNPSFPVPLSVMKADIEFIRMQPGEAAEIADCRVTAKAQMHSGDSYGYRIEHGGHTVIYTTDTEHKLDDYAQTQAFVEFFREADLVVFDSMYSLADAMSVKEDWGHSSNVVGVELCQMARARRLCLFHHEPVFDDVQLAKILEETRRFEQITREGHAVEVLSAYDGLDLAL
jgi:phosphoribosyl 1,2-cyclic phosphodiesterase